MIELPAEVNSHILSFLDASTTSSAILTHSVFRNAYKFTSNIWRKRIENEFDIPPHINAVLQSPHIVYQRLLNLRNNCDGQTQFLLEKIRNWYCGVDQDIYEAAWLLFPYTAAAQPGFEKWLNENGVAIHEFCLENGARVGNLAIVRYLIEVYHLVPDICTLRSAAYSGNLNLLKYLINKQELLPDNACFNFALRGGSLQLVEYLIQTYQFKVDQKALCLAVQSGNLHLTRKLCATFGELTIDDRILKQSLRSGNIELIEFCRGSWVSDGDFNSIDDFFRAFSPEVIHFNISAELVLYLQNNFAVMPDDMTMSYAFMRGDIDLVKILSASQLRTPLELSGYSGKIAFVKYLVDEKMMALKDALSSAIGSGNVRLFQFISKQCEITAADIEAAIDRDPCFQTCKNLKLVKLLAENYGFRQKANLQPFIESGNVLLLKYLVQEFDLARSISLKNVDSAIHHESICTAKYLISVCENFSDSSNINQDLGYRSLFPNLIKMIDERKKLLGINEVQSFDQSDDQQVVSDKKNGCTIF